MPDCLAVVSMKVATKVIEICSFDIFILSSIFSFCQPIKGSNIIVVNLFDAHTEVLSCSVFLHSVAIVSLQRFFSKNLALHHFFVPYITNGIIIYL